MRSPASKTTLSSSAAIEFRVDADIGTVSVEGVLVGDKSEPGAPFVSGSETSPGPGIPRGGVGRVDDGLFVAGSGRGARGGGLGMVDDGPFVADSKRGGKGGGAGKVDTWA